MPLPKFHGKIYLSYYINDGWTHYNALEDIPDGRIACEYVINGDPFIARSKRIVTREPLTLSESGE